MTQGSFFDLHPCPVCKGTGQKHDPETGAPAFCRCCEGTGLVNYDPDDLSEIPY